MMLAEMLRAMSDDRDDDAETTILPEAAIERLRECAKRFAEPNPYKVGDLVTPRKDGGVKGAGKPNVVVAVRDAEPDFQCEEAGGASFGGVFNVRVLHLMPGGDIYAHWVEHTSLDPYVG